MKFMRYLVLILLITGSNCTKTRIPSGVVFRHESLMRVGGHGDNFCMTWAADGSQVTSMCDGNWLGEPGHNYHNMLYRIQDTETEFHRERITGYPRFVRGTGCDNSWFGYGIVAVGEKLFSTISKTPKDSWSGPFRGIKMLESEDQGKTWYRVNRYGESRLIEPDDPARNEVSAGEMFFLEEFGLMRDSGNISAYPFSYVSFVQNGRANSASKDGYLYIYSPEGVYSPKLLLARVPAESLGVRNAWDYFVRYDEEGGVMWTRDMENRGYVCEFPDQSSDGRYFGWYSWLPSVVWNEGLGLYIMVNGGTYGGRGMTAAESDYYSAWMHEETGSLGFWYAKEPFGPWHNFFYTDYWTVDDPENRTYQPKLSSKWISKDGRDMVLIWSDAMRNESGHSHTVNYKWNQMRISIELE